MSHSSTVGEDELIKRLKARDIQAFDYVYDHYSAALYTIILRIVRKETVAEEILQDVFLKIWDKINNYDPAKGRLFTWMLNISRNHAIDRVRSREMSQERKTDGMEIFVNRIDQQQFYEIKTDAIGMKEILGRLPHDLRFVIEALYLRGYTQTELAEESGIPLGTIKTRTRAGLKELRSILHVSE